MTLECDVPDDAELRNWSSLAATGDGEALQRLLWAHGGRLTGYAIRKVGPDWRGQLEPEDVLQEAYVRIVRDIGTFSYQREDAFYHWSARIIDHAFIDCVRGLRRKKRRGHRVQPDADGGSRHQSFLDKLLQESATASRIFRGQEAIGAMMACIARLPEHYRIVVQELLIDERPASDVAAEMGRSDDAVRRMAGRAVEKLRECLGNASGFLSSHG